MKRLVLLATGIFAVLGLQAQKGLEVGVYLQPQSTWIMNQEDLDNGSQLDFVPTFKTAFGANVGFNFTDNFGIRSGLMISSQGQKYTSTEEFTLKPSTEYETKLSYIKVPILLKLNSDPEAGSAFLLNAGVQYSLRGATKKSSLTQASFDAQDYYKSSELSAVVGLGAQIRLGDKLNLNAMLRFDYTLGDIEKEGVKTFGLANANAGFIYNDQAKRSAARNLTGGLQIGLNYIIGGE
jgi:opacity protein-like surface antigen